MSRILHIIGTVVLLSAGMAQAAPFANALKKQGGKPLSFIENKGQITSEHKSTQGVDFKVDAHGMKIFIGGGQLYYQWHRPAGSTQASADIVDLKNPYAPPPSVPTEGYRMDVVLVGANKDAEVIKEEQQEYYENYYRPQCPNGITAHSFAKVTYKNIYPHIDWILYSRNNELKYDFVVHPGGNPADIQLRYQGATALSIHNGALTATTPMGTVTEQKPYSYDATTKKEIPSAFVLKDNVLSFSVQKMEGTLVIDPSLAWGTYYGESGEDDEATSVTTDKSGNVYMAGYTRSDDLIASPGASQFAHLGLYDAYIAKFNTDGVRQWGTYYGGGGDEYAYNIINDTLGALLICGSTNSPNGMETPGTQQQQLGGMPNTTDAFLAKFDYNGNRIWGTYYGGTDDDVAYALAFTLFGEIDMMGTTQSPDSIATPGTFQQVHGGGMDVMVAKFNSSGKRIWGTYYGKIMTDVGYAMVTDANGTACIAGYTTSNDLVITPNAAQLVYDTFGDAFLIKIDYNGGLYYSTYYGGNGADLAYSVAIDDAGNVYMGGTSNSTNKIATSGSFKSTGGGTFADGFMVKFDDTGQRVWGTYYGGGNEVTQIRGITIDPESKIYIAGRTGCNSGIATPDGHQTTIGLGFDGFLARFDVLGNRNWGSYYGGLYNDIINAITTDKTGKLFFCGSTFSPNNIATPDGHQNSWQGSFLNNDAFLVKFHDTTVFIVPPFNDTLICPPDSFNVNYDVQVVFGATNTFTIQLSDATGSFASPLTIGSLQSKVAGTIKCTIPSTVSPGNGYRIRIVGSSPLYMSKDNGKDIKILERPKLTATATNPICEDDTLKLFASSTVAGVTYQWTGPNGFISGDQNPVIANAQTTTQGHYIVTGTTQGCAGKDSTDITIKPRPYFTLLKGSDSVCEGNQFRFYVESSLEGSTFQWYGPKGYTSAEQNPILYDTKEEQSGRYHVLIKNNGCTSDSNYVDADIIRLTAGIESIELKYPGDTLRLNGSSNRSDVTYRWEGPKGFTSTQPKNELIDIDTSQDGTYTLTVSYKGCKATATTGVILSDALLVGLYPNPNDGRFTVKGNTKEDQEVKMAIVSAMGQLVYEDKVMTVHKHFSKAITIPANLAAGVYILHLDVKGKKHNLRFVVLK